MIELNENWKHCILFYPHLSTSLFFSIWISYSINIFLSLSRSLTHSYSFSLSLVWLSFRLSLFQSSHNSFKSCRKLNVVQSPLSCYHISPTLSLSPSLSLSSSLLSLFYLIFCPLSLAWLLVCITNSEAHYTISCRLLALRQHATCNTLRYLWPLLEAWPAKVAAAAAKRTESVPLVVAVAVVAGHACCCHLLCVGDATRRDYQTDNKRVATTEISLPLPLSLPQSLRLPLRRCHSHLPLATRHSLSERYLSGNPFLLCCCCSSSSSCCCCFFALCSSMYEYKPRLNEYKADLRGGHVKCIH